MLNPFVKIRTNPENKDQKDKDDEIID